MLPDGLIENCAFTFEICCVGGQMDDLTQNNDVIHLSRTITRGVLSLEVIQSTSGKTGRSPGGAHAADLRPLMEVPLPKKSRSSPRMADRQTVERLQLHPFNC